MTRTKNNKEKIIKRVKTFLSNVLTVLNRPELIILPGQLAFYFVLSIVPTLTLLSYFSSTLHLSSNFINDFLTKALNPNIASLVSNSLQNGYLGFRFYLSLVLGYYLASNGAASMIVTSNAIYGIKDSGFLKRRLKAFVMTVFLIILLAFMLIVPIFGQKIIEMIRYVNPDSLFFTRVITVLRILKGPFSWIIIFMFIKLIFSMAPDKKVPSKNTTVGAVFTTICWIIITTVYSYYINNFASYDIFYGGLANLVILMIWFYLLSYIFTIGIALNYREEEIRMAKKGEIKDLK